jgi:Putative zinc-finger
MRIHPRSGLRWTRARRRAVACTEVRLAVSAGRDGERSLLSARTVDRHLTGCPACRSFRSELDGIVPVFRLSAPRPVPDRLVAMLAEELPTGGSATQTGRLPNARGWSAAPRWATIAPAVVAVVALPLGAWSHPHVVPSRQPTPCTIGIHGRHPPPSR